jgi:5-formyltetrahydrofolate cyclo-ligase
VNTEPPLDVAAWREGERARLLETRRTIPLDIHQAASASIMRALAAILPGANNVTIGCYWPIRREPDCLPFMREVANRGCRVALPVVIARGTALEFRLWTETTRMEAGVWNIPQPADGARVTPAVLVIPLVGFDDEGYRLGYGGGYYDVTLASFFPRAFTMGVGFEASYLPTIYPQAHDVPMDVILTEQRTRIFRGC